MLRYLLIVLLLALPAGRATAQSCSAQVSDIDFGAVSLRAGAVNRTSGTLTISCSGALISPVGVCVRFGPGSGGAGASNNPRYMRNGAGAALAYQLRAGGHGAAYGTLNETYHLVPVIAGSGQVTMPIYAEILSTGTAIDTGLYQSVFSGISNIEISYGIASCALFGASAPVPDFRVSAETVASCELDVGAMDFGRINSLGSRPADAVASLAIRCTDGASYSVSLGMGTGAGVTDPAFRKMQNGSSTLQYGLFRDAARTLAWGEAPAQRASGTGNGYDQIFDVFGRIYAGQPTRVGTYSDSVVVTVNY